MDEGRWYELTELICWLLWYFHSRLQPIIVWNSTS